VWKGDTRIEEASTEPEYFLVLNLATSALTPVFSGEGPRRSEYPARLAVGASSLLFGCLLRQQDLINRS
jgi:hypothetical protein